MKLKLLIGILITLSLLASVEADHNTTYVPDNFSKIQWAIDKASTGDTIVVRDGTYNEDINITKKLTLKSENGSAQCSIVADRKNIVTLNADGVRFEGFNIKSNSLSDPCFGIFLRSDNNTILNNTIGNSSCTGIAVLYTDNNTISNNTITGNNKNGIFILDSHKNTVKENRLLNNALRDIYISESNNNTFVRNTLGIYPTTVSFTYGGNLSLKGVSPSSLPLDPSGYHNISKYVNVTGLDNGNSWLFLNFSYSDLDITDLEEESLKVWKYNGSWYEEGWSSNRFLDVEKNIVGANISTFSIFAPLGTNLTSDTITELQNSTGNFWINWSWNNPSTDFDHTEIWINGEWVENTTDSYYNLSALEPHTTSTISLRPVNNNGSKGEWTNQTLTIPNNPITLTNILGSYTLQEGETLRINASSNDLDGDRGTYYTNATESSINSSTGVFNWTPGVDDSGRYVWNITVVDGFGSRDTVVFEVVVDDTRAVVTNVTISNLRCETGNNFWVNYTWDSTNCSSFNVSFNGVWHNGSSMEFYGENLSAHAWGNITVYGYNTSLRVLSSPLSASTRFPNNPITLTNISDSYSIVEGESLHMDAEYMDPDGDEGIFGRNFSAGNFNSSTGELVWDTATGDAGTYRWKINVSDGYGSTAEHDFTVKVYEIASPQSLEAETGNFYVNWSWGSAEGIDSFNYTTPGGSWINGSSNTSSNFTVGPHGYYNITVIGYNKSRNCLSQPVTGTQQVPNNPPSMEDIADRTVNEGQKVHVDLDASDIDNDDLRYSCNRTDLFADFNLSSGEGNWSTSSDDAGVYYVGFGVSDGYGGTDNRTIKITVKEVSQTSETRSGGGGGGGTLAALFASTPAPTPAPTSTPTPLVSTPRMPTASENTLSQATTAPGSGGIPNATPLPAPLRIIVVKTLEEEKDVKEVFNQTSYVKFEYETIVQKVIIVFSQGNETGYRVIHRMTIVESNATANAELWALLNVSEEITYSVNRMIYPQSHRVIQESPIIGLEFNNEVGNEGELNVTVITAASENEFVNGIEINHLLILDENGPGFPPTFIILLLVGIIVAVAVYLSLRARGKQ